MCLSTPLGQQQGNVPSRPWHRTADAFWSYFTTNRFLDVNMFGYWPTRDEIASDLEGRKFDFWNLPEREEQVVQELQSVLEGLWAAAQVDVALWVLSVGVLNEELEDESERTKLRREYASDLVLRTIRVENLTSQLFGDGTHPFRLSAGDHPS